MNSLTLQSYAIGILATASLFVACQIVLGRLGGSMLRAVGLGSGAAGLLTTLYLFDHPQLVNQYGGQIVGALILLVLALLGLLRRALQK